jgi:drug/metabolite transporter (DMT)-like permease
MGHMFAGHSVLRLVHDWWPIVVGWSATAVVQRATLRSPDPAGLGMLCGILAAYSLDRIREPPRPDIPDWLGLALVGVFIGLAAAVIAVAEQRSGVAVAAAGLSAAALGPQFLATEVIGPLVVDGLLSLPGFLIASRLV